jgi:multidrug efflux pump subunit AcrA (membrane-fusion protein)
MSVDKAIPLDGAAGGGDAGSARKRGWLALGTILFLALIGGTLAVYWIQKRPRVEGSITSASTVSPEMREIDSTVTTSGTVRLRTGAQVRVGSQVSGIVRKLNVTVGSHIQKGDIIAEIDPRPLQALESRAAVVRGRSFASAAERGSGMAAEKRAGKAGEIEERFGGGGD